MSYHYTTMEGLKGIINEKCLHATHIDFLNDPSENKYFDDLLNNLLKKDEKCKLIYHTIYKEGYGSIATTGKYIISFSEEEDALPMWSYYATGNGANIEFDIDSLINQIKKLEKNNGNTTTKIEMNVEKFKIIYDEEEQEKLLKEKIIEFNDKINDIKIFNDEQKKQNMGMLMSNSDNKISKNITCFVDSLTLLKNKFKHPAYKYENEVRLVITNDPWTDSKLFSRLSQTGVLIEYILVSFDIENDIKSFTLHPLQTEIHKIGVKKFLKKYNISTNIIDNISISKIPFRKI